MDHKFASVFNYIFYLEFKPLKYCTGTSRYAIYSYNIYVPRLVSVSFLTANAVLGGTQVQYMLAG
jgi:hypothetical protein